LKPNIEIWHCFTFSSGLLEIEILRTHFHFQNFDFNFAIWQKFEISEVRKKANDQHLDLQKPTVLLCLELQKWL
jgi:hypothetical protein